MQNDAVIIEAAINEGALRHDNPYVPYSPHECARDAIAVVAAGATFAHWHARNETTGEGLGADVAAYAAAWDEMCAAKIIAYPTYPNSPPLDVSARLAHCLALARDHQLEMVPLDLGTVHQVQWDGAQLIGGGTLANPLPFLTEAAARYRELGVIVNLASFDLGSTRLAVRLAQTRVLTPPLLLKIYLSDSWMVGPDPSEAGLDLHLSQIPPDLDVEWILVPFRFRERATFERLCRYAIDRGGGFRIGIGDNAPLFGARTNVELAGEALEWARASGRPVASGHDIRRRFAPSHDRT